MTPIDHEAAKRYAEIAVKDGWWDTCADVLARAYLDLLAREQRAVELLWEIAKAPVLSDYELTKQVCAFLAERGEG